ncbi:hypothetical protein Ae168Ps1_5295c [Pseudonocardia sp. Ae168_Ps1]|nr:hypothetical protein Ae150APs1_5253c [Pseudonocardia sp. Ae150A_Ps1]OLL82889.1 hypothetical protein Ae168Ps1_5295c [Pseudonocardia sp. Ae168_Ps1]OLL82999.1 hypothetical protein Ae263Ps1_0054 [Pseudonocardia sp. Ae263_Ps1]OLL90963.1 hypothetical protein Ae356Ps1_0860c [Pseudonocardia sp. Ae356_Ps1]
MGPSDSRSTVSRISAAVIFSGAQGVGRADPSPDMSTARAPEPARVTSVVVMCVPLRGYGRR